MGRLAWVLLLASACAGTEFKSSHGGGLHSDSGSGPGRASRASARAEPETEAETETETETEAEAETETQAETEAEAETEADTETESRAWRAGPVPLREREVRAPPDPWGRSQSARLLGLRGLMGPAAPAVRGCYERYRDDLGARGECICEAACRLRAGPIAGDEHAGPITLRFPYLDVDGLVIRIEPDGRVSECGHSHVGHPESVVRVACEPASLP